jgi:hypothetical protein
MKTVFADAFYWIASINPGDNWHLLVKAVAAKLDQAQIVTTDEVPTEVLAFYSTRGVLMRRRAVELVRSVMSNPRMQRICNFVSRLRIETG